MVEGDDAGEICDDVREKLICQCRVSSVEFREHDIQGVVANYAEQGSRPESGIWHLISGILLYYSVPDKDLLLH